MACPKCTLRLVKPCKRPRVSIPSYRGFHTSPQHQRLGAFTYAQEWQTGTYHYNKSLAKTLPVAAQRADELLTQYATQTKRRVDPSNPLYKQITRTNIASQRRQPDRVLISKTTAKDFGNRMEVTAFVFDGVGAAEAEREAFRKKRMGVKEGESTQSGNQSGNQRRPAARRRTAGSIESGAASPNAPRGAGRPSGFTTAQNRAPAFRRQGGGAGAGRSNVADGSGRASGGGSEGGSGSSLIRRVAGR